jgi:hypothetical protein
MMSPTPAMHASPPDVTENRGPVADATAPASTSPSLGPLVTTSENTEDIRPREPSTAEFDAALDRLAAVVAGREHGARATLPAVRAAAEAIVGAKRQP